MKILRRSNSILLSSIYIFCFLYHLVFQYFTFTPVLSILRTSDYTEEFYFENNMGALLWNSLHREKVIFYLNDWNGNCSTRIGYFRQIQKNFPEYFFIQLEYPGYGYSSPLNLSIEEMIERCGESIFYYLEKNPVISFGFWGEGMGNLILSKIIKRFSFQPQFIIHYNLTPSITNYLFDKYSFFSSIFLFFQNRMEDYSVGLKEKNIDIYLIFNEEKNFKKYSFQFYYTLSEIPFEKKQLISFKGKGFSTFFLPSNFLSLQKKIV